MKSNMNRLKIIEYLYVMLFLPGYLFLIPSLSYQLCLHRSLKRHLKGNIDTLHDKLSSKRSLNKQEQLRNGAS